MKIRDATAERLAIRYHQLVKASEAHARAQGSCEHGITQGSCDERESTEKNLENAMTELRNLGLGLLNEDGHNRFPFIRAAYERAANLLYPPAKPTSLSAALDSLGQR